MNLERPIVRFPMYGLVFTISLLLSMALAFPDDRLKEILIVQMESQLGPTYDVTIEELNLWWLMGVSLDGVNIRERSTSPANLAAKNNAEGGEDGETTEGGTTNDEDGDGGGPKGERLLDIELDEVGARLAPIQSVLEGALTVKFSAKLGGGEISGHFVRGAKKHRVEVEVDEIDLNKTNIISAYADLPTFGTMSGDIDLELDARRGGLTDASIALGAKQLTLGPAKIYLDKFRFINVPLTNFGTLTVAIDGGRRGRVSTLNFETFEFKGRDVRGDLWGEMRMGRKTDPDLKLRMQFDQRFVKRENLGSLLKEPKLKRGKGKDNWYGVHIERRRGKIIYNGDPSIAAGKRKKNERPRKGAKKGEKRGEPKKKGPTRRRRRKK